MSLAFHAVLRSWSIPPAATFSLYLFGLVYLRGWRLLRRAGVPFVPLWRAIVFLLGIFSLWFALASPLDTFAGFVLTAHMLQHMLLMMVAPPLILLGNPLIPMVRGLPAFAAREYAGPFLNWQVSQKLGRWLTNPVRALLMMNVVLFSWHVPEMYELALRSASWHEVEHASFFLTAIIFWWPVVQAWPSRAQWPRWAMVPYLLLADLLNTALSAILVFSNRVLYPSYTVMPSLFGFSASGDQVAAGSTMWAIGSIAFFIPAIVVAVQCLANNPPDRTVATVYGKKEHGQKVSFLRRFGQLRGKKVEAVSFVAIFAITAFCLAMLLSLPSSDDDQSLRLKDHAGTFAVAVFGQSGDLETGPASFSVLVQEQASEQTLLDSTIDLTAHLVGDASSSLCSALASHEASDNKLLQTAELRLPRDGDWILDIAVRHNSESATFSLPIHVVKRKADVYYLWPYLVIMLSAAILVFVYVRRHRTPAITTSQTKY